MSNTGHTVSVVRYDEPLESVRRAVELAGGLAHVGPQDRVFIKPNIVFWTREVAFPKWGVITTSRVVEDMVHLLKEQGVGQIAIGEGIVTLNPKDTATTAHAFETLGYRNLEKRYGIRCVNVHERPFRRVDLGDEVSLDFNVDFLESDVLVDLPVLKTHAQTVVSLGIKNLKGLLNVRSRKLCHSPDPVRDLNFMVARLPRVVKRGFVLLDGIFTNERGPGYDGKIHRSNILAASTDMLSADLVGARLLGHAAETVPHLAQAARAVGRPPDLSDVNVKGEPLGGLLARHNYDFPYARDDQGELPLPMRRMGMQGVSYRKYDLTMCTYCSHLNGVVLGSLAQAWQGEPWEDVEVLTGKSMQPTAGKKKTILIGKCMYQANKDHPDIRELHAVKGCPPSARQIVAAFRAAGIPLEPTLFENMDRVPGFFMKKYEGKPEFDEALFRVE